MAVADRHLNPFSQGEIARVAHGLWRIVESMESASPQNLERLEALVAHLERQYDELNGVVIQQGRELARVRQQLQRVAASLEGMELDRIKAHNPKPPHSVI